MQTTDMKTFLLVSLLQSSAVDIIYFCRTNKQHAQLCKSNILWQRLIKRDFSQDYLGSCALCEYTRLLVQDIERLISEYMSLQRRKVLLDENYMDEVRTDWAYDLITYTEFQRRIDIAWNNYRESSDILADLETLQQRMQNDFETDNMILIHQIKVPFNLIDFLSTVWYRDEDPKTLISLLLSRDELTKEIDNLNSYLD